jgi:transposase
MPNLSHGWGAWIPSYSPPSITEVPRRKPIWPLLEPEPLWSGPARNWSTTCVEPTQLVNHVRGAVKAVGSRLPSSSTPAFPSKVAAHIPEELHTTLSPLLETIKTLSQQISVADRRIEQLAAERYPETKRLRQVAGVGPLTALCFVLTLEDPRRFSSSRAVGAYLGMTTTAHQQKRGYHVAAAAGRLSSLHPRLVRS